MKLPTQMFLAFFAAASVLGIGIYANYEKTKTHKIGVFDDEWRCPYCYHWAPRGERCQNPKCPSKY